MKETLIIVHLSSLDSYQAFYGVTSTLQLVTNLKMAIITHSGPVIIMDQEWDDVSEETKVFRQSVLDLQQYCPLRIFHHDELTDISPWQDGMRQLAKLVRSYQTSRVRLGGLWSSQNGVSGCVHETHRQLKARNIPCYLDTSICALEENDVRA